MIRYISIVLVVWGLIAQPLTAVMLAHMTNDTTHSMMVSDVGVLAHADGHHDSDQNTGESSKAPCHEKVVDEPPSETCDKCNLSCVNGHCASSCVIIGAAVVQQSVVNLDLKGSTLIATTSKARIYGLPSQIFHPPKHS